MKKKSVLIVSFVGALLLSSQFFFGSDACYTNELCNRVNDFINQDNLTVILIMPFVFLFSLITYKMRDEAFQAWWKPARFFVPLIMLVTFLVNSQTRSGGMGISGAIAGGFDIFLIGIFYFIFILTSLIRIISVYRKK